MTTILAISNYVSQVDSDFNVEDYNDLDIGPPAANMEEFLEAYASFPYDFE